MVLFFLVLATHKINKTPKTTRTNKINIIIFLHAHKMYVCTYADGTSNSGDRDFFFLRLEQRIGGKPIQARTLSVYPV